MSSLCDLDANSLMDANGNARLLRRIGKHSKDMIACWADSALLVFLRRFSRHVAWMDLQMILGGSRAELSRIFSYMMRMLYKRYATEHLLGLQHRAHDLDILKFRDFVGET